MAKEPKYKVDKVPTAASETGFYWAIWFCDRDVVFWTEEAANRACEMLNVAEGLLKIKRKARDLEAALSYFNEQD